MTISSDLPHAIQVNGNEKEIEEKYYSKVNGINNILENYNLATSSMNADTAIITAINGGKSEYMKAANYNNLVWLSQSFADNSSALYGTGTPNPHNMARFLDRNLLIEDPQACLDMISSGHGTADMIYNYQTFYPTSWQKYVDGSLKTLLSDVDIPAEHRASLYGTTGIETNHAYSFATLSAKLASDMKRSQNQTAQPAQKQQKSRSVPEGISMQNDDYSPFTSQKSKELNV